MLLSALVAMTAAMTAAADYPTLYLRGAMTNDGLFVSLRARYFNYF